MKLGGFCVVMVSLVMSVPLYADADANPSAFCVSAACQKDFNKLERLARHGSGEAATLVALAYAKGEGVAQNLDKAKLSITKATGWRDASGMHVLSIWLREGGVVTQDVEKANIWLDRAVAKKYAPAMLDKAKLLLLNNSPQDDREAMSLLQAAHDKHYTPATYLLAQLYVAGIAVDVDLVQAGELYKRAALRNYADSRQQLSGIIAILEQAGRLDTSAEDASKREAQLSSLREIDDIEIMTINARPFNPESDLNNIAKILAKSALHSRTAGSRIRGSTCETSTTRCVIAFQRGAQGMTHATVGEALNVDNR